MVYERCAGLDVHKQSGVACLLIQAPNGPPRKARQTFSTMPADLLRLRDWLMAQRCTQVAMESTGVVWNPLFTVLEGHLEALLVTAHHIKAVPGRKTDGKDAQGLAEVLQHGLLRPRFLPPAWQRALRTLTRARASLTEERARTIARLQKALEDANSKLAAVATDLLGQSAHQMVPGWLAGEADPATLAEFARARMRSTPEPLAQALSGYLQPHQRVVILEHLAQIDAVEESMTRLSAEIAERLRPDEVVLQRLETIPGIKRRLAEIILAEIGPDMQRFPRAQHVASWADIGPGPHASAGTRVSGKTRKGSPWLRTALVEAARAASRCKTSSWSAHYHHIAVRRGTKRAAVARAHTRLIIV